jgi:hypothetical protein
VAWFYDLLGGVDLLMTGRWRLRPGGRLVLLEHVVSLRPWLGSLMRRVDPVMVRLCGAHIAPDTVANVRAAGFDDVRSTSLWHEVVRLIEARA